MSLILVGVNELDYVWVVGIGEDRDFVLHAHNILFGHFALRQNLDSDSFARVSLLSFSHSSKSSPKQYT
jgi:hypothetical protein